ncbi:GNAT family N-acetyltransferase [Novosphingobium sp. MBES04]|uniref:GNAT family N-acetyltransferase n=1 Tax=Novosphingobium sp. MBES04 TaxID=1206458 RepID=UPI00057EBE16|nr:GNAT family N-acetyltransferase [Novosphingobium sp. MBES04]GAM04092.1 N-acetyltransferase GCN5 [Novosphingobium sp. MBES04]
MDLREAGPTDAVALAELGARSFTAKFGHLYRPEDLANFLAEAHSEENVAAEIANPAMPIMLALEDGRLLGYCKLKLACGWPEHARGTKAIELKQLYTDPQATGRGIGAKLMNWALAKVRVEGADEIQLSVYSENPGAQKFYQRYGFEKVGDIFFMVGEKRDDEFLYALSL